jgi:hypothetical protein
MARAFHTSLSVALLLILSSSRVAAAASANHGKIDPPLARLKKQMQALVDRKEWIVEKVLPVDLGGDMKSSTAVLLRATRSTGSSGVGEPLFAVDLLIVEAGTKIVYRFTSSASFPYHKDEVFFVDDLLDSRDVTGDGVDEVLFHSGSKGASDWSTREHVIRRAPEDGGLWNVEEDSFVHSWRRTFTWLESPGGTLAIVADDLDPASSDDPHTCHGCPKFYQYLVYRWEKTKKTFILWRSIQSEKEFDGNVDPLKADLPFIREKLSKDCP